MAAAAAVVISTTSWVMLHNSALVVGSMQKISSWLVRLLLAPTAVEMVMRAASGSRIYSSSSTTSTGRPDEFYVLVRLCWSAARGLWMEEHHEMRWPCLARRQDDFIHGERHLHIISSRVFDITNVTPVMVVGKLATVSDVWPPSGKLNHLWNEMNRLGLK